MNLLTLCELVFFLGYGINYFVGYKWLGIVVAIAAIIVGVIMLISGFKIL